MTTYAPLLETVPSGEKVELFITPAEALKLLKRVRRVSFFLRVQMFVYSVEPSEGVNARGWDLNETINATAAQVEKVLQAKAKFADMKREKDGTELTIEVARLGDCLFFG